MKASSSRRRADAMLLEELDGFIAGLLICPELIKPSEWLPIVWGSEEDEPAFYDIPLDHLNRVLGLVMEHYNDVVHGQLIESDPIVTATSCLCRRQAA